MAGRFACPDWWDRLQAGLSPMPDIEQLLDRKAADKALAVYQRLRLPDVPGQPFIGDDQDDWFSPIIRAVFGAKEKSGKRMVGELLAMVPKKNAKTTKAAALGVVSMLLNERPRADMLLLGPTQKISDTAFMQAAGMIKADETGYLQDRLLVRDHLKMIECQVTGARLMIRTFGMDVLTGVKPVLVILDELHLVGGMHYADDVMRQVRGGLIFPESLLVMITTQSDHMPQGVWKKVLGYARDVRDGRIDDHRMLPVMYEFPDSIQRDEAKPWLDPDLWHLVNPNMGKSFDTDKLIELHSKAQHDGPREVLAWATQHLNVEIGVALHDGRWVAADYWEGAGEPGLTLEALIARSEVIVAGIDGGGLDDLLGVAVLGREKGTRRWLHWGRAWGHEIVLERRKDIAAKLRDLEAAGDLVICTRATQDHEEVADIMQRLWESGLMPEKAAIGLDVAGVPAQIDELTSRGIPDEALLGIQQGGWLSSAIWGVERKLADGTFVHGAQPLMRWTIGNAKAVLKGNSVAITKSEAGRAKIDPVAAMLNAASLMARNPEVARSREPAIMVI